MGGIVAYCINHTKFKGQLKPMCEMALICIRNTHNH